MVGRNHRLPQSCHVITCFARMYGQAHAGANQVDDHCNANGDESVANANHTGAALACNGTCGTYTCGTCGA